MNYRHIFHAGNFADVVKHTVLLQLLTYLQNKPTPYCYIDTHAGEGFYDLSVESAQKTGEAEEGIDRLLNYQGTHPASVQQYVDLVKSAQHYPGSPMLAKQVMRQQDAMILNEKHPQTYQTLKENFNGYKNIAIHQRDAYEFLPAIIPPIAKRGLVLIDPSFEDEHEMEHVKTCLLECAKRWPQGMYLIWVPIVGRSYYTAADLKHTGFESYLNIEFTVNTPSNEAQGLIGCSLLIINPPWQIETVLTPMLSHLWQLMHVDPMSRWRVL